MWVLIQSINANEFYNTKTTYNSIKFKIRDIFWMFLS